MQENGRRRRVEPTGEWEQIELLCAWPEQRTYELIRPLVLFGGPAVERAAETGAASERTLQRRVARFDAEGMESLFGSEHARRKRLPPAVAQPRLFGLDVLGEAGRLKALKLGGYAPRRPRGPLAWQQALFPYADII